MKTLIKRNTSVILLTIIIVASITFTCFAIDRKLGEANSRPDYEALSAFRHYQMQTVPMNPELR